MGPTLKRVESRSSPKGHAMLAACVDTSHKDFQVQAVGLDFINIVHLGCDGLATCPVHPALADGWMDGWMPKARAGAQAKTVAPRLKLDCLCRPLV